MWLLKTLLPIVAFSFPTQSKIVGCDDVKCPTEGHPSGTIACSNANDGVGVASIESKVSDDGPLTWTVRGETISRPNGSSGWISYRKTFHLATPPSLDLNNGSFHGCSFLFSGITTVLQIDDGFHGWSKFECDTVMGDSCTKDMVTQIKTNLTSLLNTKPKLSELTLCGGLREFMEQAPLPDSCGAEGRLRRWGPIAEKNIAGINTILTKPESQDKCSITTGGPSYNIYPMMYDSVEVSTKDDSEAGELWRSGTTPLMTAFFSYNGDADFCTHP